MYWYPVWSVDMQLSSVIFATCILQMCVILSMHQDVNRATVCAQCTMIHIWPWCCDAMQYSKELGHSFFSNGTVCPQSLSVVKFVAGSVICYFLRSS